MQRFFSHSPVFSLALASLLLFSCVSKKKYLLETNDRLSAQQYATVLKGQLDMLNERFSTLKDSSGKQQSLIGEQAATIETLKGQLASLQADKVRLEADKARIQQELTSISNQALSQSQKLDAALQSKIAELNRQQAMIDQLQGAIEQRDQTMQNILSRIQSAFEQYSTDELSVELRNGKVYIAMSDKLLFQSGSATVDKRGKEALGNLANVLQKDPDIKIMVEGHTDNVPLRAGGTYKDNWDLSVIRATSVLRILSKDYGINPQQITASGKGDTTPKASNDTPEGRALNRRTEIIIEPRLDEIYQIIESRS